MDIKAQSAQLNVHTHVRMINLFETYGQKIFNLAYRMTGNKEDAADIS